MQIDYQFTPMVQSFIYDNMPHGGYKIVHNRLKSVNKDITMTDVKSAVRYINKKNNHYILLECCKFIAESNILLNEYATSFVQKEKAE